MHLDTLLSFMLTPIKFPLFVLALGLAALVFLAFRLSKRNGELNALTSLFNAVQDQNNKHVKETALETVTLSSQIQRLMEENTRLKQMLDSETQRLYICIDAKNQLSEWSDAG